MFAELTQHSKSKGLTTSSETIMDDDGATYDVLEVSRGDVSVYVLRWSNFLLCGQEHDVYLVLEAMDFIYAESVSDFFEGSVVFDHQPLDTITELLN